MNELSAQASKRATAPGTTIYEEIGNWASAASCEQIGRHGVRYGLVAVILWIAAMKFTAYEAEAISGLVANSPLISWVYSVLSHRAFAAVLGIVELTVAALIAIKPYSPRAGVVGAIAAIGMFITTLSFMVTTPGVFEPSAGGFPALSVLPGQFLVKDIVLLGVSIWLLGDALKSVPALQREGH